MKGTIFQGSPIPLTKWFKAVLLMSQTPEGVSAKELERRLHVTYPTAWRMAKRIRSVRPQHVAIDDPLYFDSFLVACVAQEEEVALV